MATTSSSKPAGWDEQIVPTLRKRLENESAYLSNRMSQSNLSSNIAGPSTQTSKGWYNDHDDYPSDLSYLSGSPPDFSRRPSAINTNTNTTPERYGPSTSSKQPLKTLKHHKSHHNLTPPRHAPPERMPSSPALKSSIAMGKTRSTSPELGSGLSSTIHRKTSMPVSMRASLELSETRMPEAFIKNELPPFVMYPEEAMKIAQSGHSYDRSEQDLYTESRRERDQQDEEGSAAGKRKRAETIGNPLNPSVGVENEQRGGTGMGLSKSQGPGSRINAGARSQVPGIGHPTQRANINTNTKSRAASSRSPPMQSSPSVRSASLGTHTQTSTPSSSRFGVAAHLVPPEQTWTPPKGANWDEVILPTVAKKLGMASSPLRPSAGLGGEEGDLAVEWDKDGVPIRWEKRPSKSSATSLDEFGHKPPLPPNSGRRSPFEVNSQGSQRSAFSPTFEVSPENPLNQSGSSRVSTPTPAPLRTLGAGISPIRISNSHTSELRPPSPAPTPTLQPAGDDNSNLTPTPSPGLTKKPSFLRRISGTGTTSRQSSNASLRQSPIRRAIHDRTPSGQAQGFVERAPTPSHHLRQASFTNGVAAHIRAAEMGEEVSSPTSSFGMSPRGGVAPSTKPKRQTKDEDTHGKGCGCVIM